MTLALGAIGTAAGTLGCSSNSQHVTRATLQDQNASGASVGAIVGRGEIFQIMTQLEVYYQSPLGLNRTEGLSIDGRPDFEALAAWVFDVYLNARIAGLNSTQSWDRVIASIQQTPEWKSRHPDATPVAAPDPLSNPVAPPIGRPELLRVMDRLHAFYASLDGLNRPDGLSINKKPDLEGIAAWVFDVYVNARSQGVVESVAWNRVVSLIQQSGEWNGHHHGEPTLPGCANTIVRSAVDAPLGSYCVELETLAGATTDASAVVQACIDRTPNYQALELPAGRFTINKQINVHSPITIRTRGKTAQDPKCEASAASSGCAEFFAGTSLFVKMGMMVVNGSASGATLDHLVFDGNRQGRMGTRAAQECSKSVSDGPQIGYNLTLYGSGVTLTNSVSKRALCGTAVQVGTVKEIEISNNTFNANGVHDVSMMWADGLTVGDASCSVFEGNEAFDNTDVDMIFGGCQKCRIENNRITHSDSFAQSTYGALMLYAWTSTSGDYTGTRVGHNVIDCSAGKRCGFGIYIGTDAWWTRAVQLKGGSVFHNVIKNAQQGLNVDELTGPMEIVNNSVSSSGGVFFTSAGDRLSSQINISPNSLKWVTPSPMFPFTSDEWDGAIPNWWQIPY